MNYILMGEKSKEMLRKYYGGREGRDGGEESFCSHLNKIVQKLREKSVEYSGESRNKA